MLLIQKGGLYVDSIDFHSSNCNTGITGGAVNTAVGTVSAAEQKKKKRRLTC